MPKIELQKNLTQKNKDYIRHLTYRMLIRKSKPPWINKPASSAVLASSWETPPKPTILKHVFTALWPYGYAGRIL